VLDERALPTWWLQTAFDRCGDLHFERPTKPSIWTRRAVATGRAHASFRRTAEIVYCRATLCARSTAAATSPSEPVLRVGEPFRKQHVALRQAETDSRLNVFFCEQQIGVIDLRTAKACGFVDIAAAMPTIPQDNRKSHGNRIQKDEKISVRYVSDTCQTSLRSKQSAERGTISNSHAGVTVSGKHGGFVVALSVLTPARSANPMPPRLFRESSWVVWSTNDGMFRRVMPQATCRC